MVASRPTSILYDHRGPALAALAGVVGAVVVGVPFLVVAVLLRVFGPSGGIGADRHPGLWLSVSTATAVTLLLAVFAIAATFRAGRRAYMRRVFDLVAERERELLDEVERDLSWLDDAVATRPPVGQLDDSDEVASIPLHKDAKSLVRERTAWFATALTSQAKMLAEFEGHDLVLTQHVREAFDVVLRGPRSRPWANEIASTLGGILFGFGASAFVSEASRNEGLRLWHTVVFVVLTIIGVVVALVAALTKR